MQKSSVSTSLQTTLNSNQKNNEAYLMDLVKNLELELGYHIIALKKAEKMIKLTQNENALLKDQNKQLKSKCYQLQIKLVQCQNQRSKIGNEICSRYQKGSIYSQKNKQKYAEPSQNLELKLRTNIEAQNRVKMRKQVIEPETAKPRRKEKLFESGRPVNYLGLQNLSNSISPLKKFDKKDGSASKNTVVSMSFIPLEQLQLQTRWR